MQALAELLLAAVCLGAGGFLYWAVVAPGDGRLRGRRRARAVAATRWTAGHYADDAGRTHVVVQRVLAGGGEPELLDRREVTVVPEEAVDWSVALSAALTEARVRAEVLNSEGGPRSLR